MTIKSNERKVICITLFRRRSSMNYVVLQAVVKWKQFTRKKIYLKEKSHEENERNTFYTRNSVSEQSRLRQDETAPTRSMSTTIDYNTEHKYGQAITNDHPFVMSTRAINTEPVENWIANDNSTLNFRLREKKPVCERKKSIRDSSHPSDVKQFLPILESENENDIKSLSNSATTETVDDNPWIPTEHEKRFRSRSRDRNDPFRKSLRRALSQSPSCSSSVRSKYSSDHDIFVKEDVDGLSPCHTQPHQCLSTVNSNIVIINEPLRRLSFDEDEEKEEVNIKSDKPSGNKKNKRRKFLRRPYFRILKWITAIRRRRKRR